MKNKEKQKQALDHAETAKAFKFLGVADLDELQKEADSIPLGPELSTEAR